VRLEGFDQLKNPMTSSGFEPACSIVPQPTTLPRALIILEGHCKLNMTQKEVIYDKGNIKFNRNMFRGVTD
jgi:hypothetical protein